MNLLKWCRAFYRGLDRYLTNEWEAVPENVKAFLGWALKMFNAFLLGYLWGRVFGYDAGFLDGFNFKQMVNFNSTNFTVPDFTTLDFLMKR